MRRREEKGRAEPDRARALDILQATPMSVSAARVNPPLARAPSGTEPRSRATVTFQTDPGDRLINFFVLVESTHLDHSPPPNAFPNNSVQRSFE